MALTVKERLLLFIQSQQLSQIDFAEKCGLSRGYVNNVKDGIYQSSLRKISDAFPELNTEWLLMGKGKMYRKNEEFVPNEDLIRMYRKLDAQQEKIDKLTNKIDELLKRLEK